jgi:imidazolonepropionase
LEKVDDDDIKSMSLNKICGVLLPTTALILRIENPPARKMISEGVIVALGSDFNPNAHCLSMPTVMNLACIRMNMTMNESLVASTINSAGFFVH